MRVSDYSCFSLQEMRNLLDDDKHSISEVNLASENIARAPGELSDKRSVTEQADRIVKRRDTLDRVIDGRIATLEKQVDKANAFYKVNAVIEEWVPQIEEALDEKEPQLKDPNEIKAQMKKLQVRSVILVIFVRQPMLNM